MAGARLIFLSILALFPLTQLEATVVAVFTHVEGQVEVQRGSDTQDRFPARVGQALASGDTVFTGEDGRADISVRSGVMQNVRLGSGRAWQAPSGRGLARGPVFIRAVVAAVYRDASGRPQILLPRWTRVVGLPFGLNWAREFPDADKARLYIYDQAGQQVLALSGVGGATIPSGSLGAGEDFRWRLVSAEDDLLATGGFRIISPDDLAGVRQRLAETDVDSDDTTVDWGVLEQVAILVDEELYLQAARMLASAIQRRPEDEVLMEWLLWTAQLAAAGHPYPADNEPADGALR